MSIWVSCSPSRTRRGRPVSTATWYLPPWTQTFKGNIQWKEKGHAQLGSAQQDCREGTVGKPSSEPPSLSDTCNCLNDAGDSLFSSLGAHHAEVHPETLIKTSKRERYNGNHCKQLIFLAVKKYDPQMRDIRPERSQLSFDKLDLSRNSNCPKSTVCPSPPICHFPPVWKCYLRSFQNLPVEVTGAFPSHSHFRDRGTSTTRGSGH